MSILIGIKKEHASGSYYSSEGLGGFSIDTNNMVIIKEGKKSDLVNYVRRMRDNAPEALRKLNKLEDTLEFSQISEENYEKEREKYLKMLYLLRFDTLMILEGDII